MNFSFSDSGRRALDAFFAWLPQLVGALVILIIGYIVAKILSGLVATALNKVGLDRRLFATSGGNYIRNAVTSPSKFLGSVAFWLLYLGAISLAISALGIEPLTDFVASIYSYLPNVIAALAIFLVAAAISGAVAALATRFLGDTPTGKLIATILPTLTMAIAVFMILNQLQIAKEIVNITYAGLIATMVLTVGLSFGLGGREVAAELLREGYQKARENTAQVRADARRGKQRAQDELSS